MTAALRSVNDVSPTSPGRGSHHTRNTSADEPGGDDGPRSEQWSLIVSPAITPTAAAGTKAISSRISRRRPSVRVRRHRRRAGRAVASTARRPPGSLRSGWRSRRCRRRAFRHPHRGRGAVATRGGRSTTGQVLGEPFDGTEDDRFEGRERSGGVERQQHGCHERHHYAGREAEATVPPSSVAETCVGGSGHGCSARSCRRARRVRRARGGTRRLDGVGSRVATITIAAARVVLHDLHLAEEVAECRDAVPQRRRRRCCRSGTSVSHPADTGDDGHEGPHDRDEPGEHERRRPATVEERLGAHDVQRVEQAASRPVEQARPDTQAEEVTDLVAEHRRDEHDECRDGQWGST